MILLLLAWISGYPHSPWIIQGIARQEVTKSWKSMLRNFLMTIFEFIGQFYFQNDVFKLQEVFLEHGIRIFLENQLGSFFLYRFETNQRS
jgi:hypothetical protein